MIDERLYRISAKRTKLAIPIPVCIWRNVSFCSKPVVLVSSLELTVRYSCACCHLEIWLQCLQGVDCRRPENKNLLIASGCIWTPPVLQAFHSIKLKVRLHTYIRPVIELKGSGHNGLFARLLLIAFTCSMAQQPLQGLQTPVRPVAISCVASQSVWISPLSVSQWFFLNRFVRESLLSCTNRFTR